MSPDPNRRARGALGWLAAPTRAAPRRFSTRLAWLLVCVAVGTVIGVVGSALTGDALWYIAIPAAIAVGWWFIADPSMCEPPARRGAGAAPGDRDAQEPLQ